jgi:uncharacterized protein involved in propanediol utilization
MTGRGVAQGHHGEIVQGVFDAGDGTLRRALVTFPCAELTSSVEFRPGGPGHVEVRPAWKVKAQAAATMCLDLLGEPRSGVLEVWTNIAVGRGLGSSTADVVGSIRAVAHAFGKPLAPADVGLLAARAEEASDAVMFDTAVLFGNRDGFVLEDLGRPLPQLEVLSIDARTDGVATLAMPPPAYDPHEVGTFRALRGLLRRAVALGSPRLVARVATASARINRRRFPMPLFELAERVCARVSGLGVQAAHSGTVVGLLFDPADDELEAKIEAARSLLSAEGTSLWRFRSGTIAPAG